MPKSGTSKHVNSKRITIYRSGTFLDDVQDGAKEFLELSNKSIGAYCPGNMGNVPGTGLSFSEIDLLMPRILGIPKEDRGFQEAWHKFFNSVLTKVPYHSGIELEIGLEKDNKASVSAENMPIDLQDFLRWRHAREHPRVAANKEEAKGNQLKEFYIFDPESVLEETTRINQDKDKALTLYLSLKTDPKKVDMMLTLMEVDPREYHGPGADERKMSKLRQLSDDKADKFLAQHEGKNFEQRYLLQSLLNTEILRKIGNQYVDNETGDIMGHSVEEVVYWFLDEKHADKLSILKTRLQEALKKKIGKPSTRTAKTTAR